jgi:hypothetical protein
MADPDSGKQGSSRDVAGRGNARIDGEPEHEGVCGSCGATAHLHEGMCRRCHQVALEERRAVVGTRHEPLQPPPHQAPPAPLHGPPVRRRGA